LFVNKEELIEIVGMLCKRRLQSDDCNKEESEELEEDSSQEDDNYASECNRVDESDGEM
jgi:hypothetical protein